MASWTNAHEPCWECNSTNTESRGFCGSQPKEQDIQCFDCGFWAHHDGEKDITTKGFADTHNCPTCNNGGRLTVSKNDDGTLNYEIWCLSCKNLEPVENPTNEMLDFGTLVLTKP